MRQTACLMSNPVKVNNPVALSNLYRFLGRFSRRHIDDMFCTFPIKEALTVLINCLSKRQIDAKLLIFPRK